MLQSLKKNKNYNKNSQWISNDQIDNWWLISNVISKCKSHGKFIDIKQTCGVS